jgi:NAD-dependent dihydropyrimidine dehydrogenase PreA subunit
MSYIIGSKCVSTCDTACVNACPVDCIHGPIDINGSGAEVKGLRQRRRIAIVYQSR